MKFYINGSINGKYEGPSNLMESAAYKKMILRLMANPKIVEIVKDGDLKIAKLANETMERLNISKLPHSLYSPDISPNDFFLYGYTKEKLKGSTHSSENELFDHIVRIINQIYKTVW